MSAGQQVGLRGCDAQGSPGEAGLVDRLVDLHQEVAKLPLSPDRTSQGEESSCRSPTLLEVCQTR